MRRPEHDPDLPADLLSVRDAADNLGISRQRVHALIRCAGLDAVRRGRWWVVTRYSCAVYALERGRPLSAHELARRRAVLADKRRHGAKGGDRG